MSVPAAKTNFTLYCFALLAAFTVVFSSCITNYPRNKPFVYKTNINIVGKYSDDEKKLLEQQMDQQLHDSIRVRWQRKFVVVKVRKNPAVFDSANMSLSQRYMETMLHTLGYLRDSIHPGYKIDTVEDQYRTTVTFDVMPGKLFRLDSVWYNLLDSVPRTANIDTLQKLTMQSFDQRIIHKGDPFSSYLISSELDRIADLARNNGYLRFTKEQLLAVWDTVGRLLIRPATTIEEQLQQLEEIRRRRENPISDVEIRLRPNVDTNRLTRYYVGEVRVFPDADADSAEHRNYTPRIDILTRNRYKIISYHNLFKPRKLPHFISLKRGDLYTQTNYLRTQNRFSALPAWRVVTVNQLPRAGTDTVDFEIILVPADKYRADITFDVSNNRGNLGGEGNLIGLGLNLPFVNRNFARAANLATTNFRYGVELSTRNGSSPVQTQQFLLSHTIQIPRLPRLNFIPRDFRENGQTFITTNAAYTDRIDYYKVLSFNASLAYEFSRGKTTYTIRWPNIEYNTLQRRKNLDELIKNNRSYQYIFNDGLIVSGLGSLNRVNAKKNVTNSFRLSPEIAGFPGLIKEIAPKTKLYHFLKADVEFSQVIRSGPLKRSSVAWRIFAGAGKPVTIGTRDGLPDTINYYLPFFRQYYAGGPSSMRAWPLRKLGPGSTVKSFARDIAPDRFGDMRLELNAEWRIYLTQFLGAYPMETVAFADMGNVWFLRKNPDFPNGEIAPNLDRLWKDVGIGVGTGLRIDFEFLLLRFDFAWKAKDPSPEIPEAQNKWFYDWHLGFKGRYGTQFQLGINYPF